MLAEILITLLIGFVFFLYKLTQKPRPLWDANQGMNTLGDNSRCLGVLEMAMAAGAEFGTLILSNGLILRSKKPLTIHLLNKALLAASKKHPLMRMRLVKEDGIFMHMKEIEDFQVDLEACNTTDWQAVMEEQILQLFDAEKGPLWRVRFLPKVEYDDGDQSGFPYQSACVFALHHAITDGPSYSRFFNEFLISLHKIINNEEPVVEAMQLLPPVDSYIDAAPVYSKTFSLKVNLIRLITSCPPLIRFMMSNMTKPGLYVTKLGVEKDRDPQAVKSVRIVPMELSQAQTSALLSACKRHKTTVHCAIQTAACFAYCSIADGGEVTEKHIINSSPTVNLRPFLGAQELQGYHGAYFAGCMLNTTIKPGALFWDVVAKVNTDLQAMLKSNGPFIFINMFGNIMRSLGPQVFALMTKFSSKCPGGRNRDLVFTNLGNLKFLDRDKTSEVKLTACFGCSAEQNMGAVFANNLATFNGKLFWTFVYYPHVTSYEQAKQYADTTIDIVMKAIKE